MQGQRQRREALECCKPVGEHEDNATWGRQCNDRVREVRSLSVVRMRGSTEIMWRRAWKGDPWTLALERLPSASKGNEENADGGALKCGLARRTQRLSRNAPPPPNVRRSHACGPADSAARLPTSTGTAS
jgi:hypothetical protein